MKATENTSPCTGHSDGRHRWDFDGSCMGSPCLAYNKKNDMRPTYEKGREEQSMKTTHEVDDPMKEIIDMTHQLARLIDAIGDRQLRQTIDEHNVKIRLLARDGHLKNLNGGTT